MKKLNFFLIGILAIFATIITFSSCNKAEVTPSSSLENNDETLERIIDFKQKVENPNQQKSTEEVSVEEAVWLVEAALNYSYCIKTEEQANAGTNVIAVDSLFYQVNNNNDKVSLAQAISTYQTIETDMAEMLATYQSSVKFYDIVDVEYKDGNFAAYVSIRYKEVEEKSTTGFVSAYTIRHDWYWGHSLGEYPWAAGQCDGTNQGRDATTEIKNWIAARQAVYANVYYTDIYYVGSFNTASDYNNSNNGINLSSYGVDMFSVDVDIVFSNAWDVATYICLSASECTYYAQQCQSALSVIENNFIDQSEDITYTILTGQQYHDNPYVGPTNLFHMYAIQAGTRHQSIPNWEE